MVSSVLQKINNKAGDMMSPDGQCCWLPASFQSRAKRDLGTILKAELFKAIQHGNHNT